MEIHNACWLARASARPATFPERHACGSRDPVYLLAGQGICQAGHIPRTSCLREPGSSVPVVGWPGYSARRLHSPNVVPAGAGIQCTCWLARVSDSRPHPPSVIPAKAGIQYLIGHPVCPLQCRPLGSHVAVLDSCLLFRPRASISQGRQRGDDFVRGLGHVLDSCVRRHDGGGTMSFGAWVTLWIPAFARMTAGGRWRSGLGSRC